MPVRKFRTVEELNQVRWLERGTPRLWQAMREISRMARATVGHWFPPGVYKHRTLEEAALLRQAWEDQNVARYQRRLAATRAGTGPDGPSLLWQLLTVGPREPLQAALRASFCEADGASQILRWRAAGCPMTVDDLVGALGDPARRPAAEDLLGALAEEPGRSPEAARAWGPFLAALRDLVPRIEAGGLRDRLASVAGQFAEGPPVDDR